MRNRIILLFWVLFGVVLMLSFFLSCDRAVIVIDHFYSIRGIIKNKISGQPIDSAWINISADSSLYYRYSDSNGRFHLTFKIYSNNQQRIFMGKDGYEDFDTLINISNPHITMDTLNIFLNPE